MCKSSNSMLFRQIQKIKQFFDSLDFDRSGRIGAEELEEPLIGLGFIDSKEEIKKMWSLIDKNSSG